MPMVLKKVVKPIDLYGYKLIVEVDVDIQHADPGKEVGRIAQWARDMIIKKVLAKISEMGDIKVNVNTRIVRDPMA